ncbi:hypothetical protein [Streptomyces subrutilus]|uniref:hypothetical protein n=1 Tax=Streptomyces subrutilus TaxID=36818 RepID=UPI001E464CE1|nr:hypothetical protein [Streptomyces subrutilus]
MSEPMESSTRRPDYPPKTPPPPKRPVHLPSPNPDSTPVPVNPSKPKTKSLIPPGMGQSQPLAASARMEVRNRRVANWALAANRWAAKKAAEKVILTVRGWGYTRPEDATVETVVGLLVGAAVADAGKRISVHLADQDGMVLIVVLSHTAAAPQAGFLAELAAVAGSISCGTEESDEGRRVWVLLDTVPPRRRVAA